MPLYTYCAFSVMAFACGSFSAFAAEDKFSDHAWFSKFEACMEETKAPLVFHNGHAYLYNRFHGSLRYIGPYEIEGQTAVFRIYRGMETSISCSIQDDGKLAMTVSAVTRNMGPESFIDKEKAPWVLAEIKDRELIDRAVNLIEKEMKASQPPGAATMVVSPGDSHAPSQPQAGSPKPLGK